MLTTRFIALSVALVLTLAIAASVAAQAGPVGVGETATYVGADGSEHGVVAVTEVLDPFTGYPADQPPKPGMKYVVVTLTIEGTGAGGITLDRYAVWLHDSTGALWQRTVDSPAVPAGFPQPELAATTVGPGSRISGYLVYVIPDDVSVQEVLFQPEPGVLLVLADLGAPRPAVATTVTMSAADGATVVAEVKKVEDPYRRFKRGSRPVKGGRFVMVTTSFENIGDGRFALEPGGVVLRDARGAVWAPTSVKPARKPKVPTLRGVGMGPGDLVVGRLGYQVPARVSLDGLYYQGDGRLYRLADLTGPQPEPSLDSPIPSAAP